MEKRVVLATILSVLILLTWSWLFPPPKRQAPAPVPEQTEPAEQTEPVDAGGEPQRAGAPADTAPEIDEAPPAEAIQSASEREETVENDLFQVVLSNRGARAVSWRLREYTTNGGEPLELLPQSDQLPSAMLALDLDDRSVAEQLNDALYEVESHAVTTGGRRARQVRFSWADGRGLQAVKTLTFEEGSYLVDLDVEVTDRGRRLPVRVVLGPGFGAQEPTVKRSTYYYDGQVLWNSAGSVRRMKKRKVEAEGGGVAGPLIWAGLEDQYFTALVLPGIDRGELAWRSASAEAAGEEIKAPMVSVAVGAEQVRLFVGPKKYTLLRGLGFQLGQAVWFATNTYLAWISRHIFLGLIWIHDHTVPNYGLAIVLSTFVLRLLLFPVNQYSMVSMKKTQLQMQKLQPKINAIRNRYRKSKDSEGRNKMNQELMELYRQEGVNPMGGLSGCLPLAAQFPILIGFYNMLTVAVELRGAPFFGWIHDLSQRDPFWITPILMGVTMFLQQRMAMARIKDPVQLQQQRFMMFMPIVFTWICLQMPSGMVLYWFVNNLLGMGQQWLVNRHTSRLETAAQKA